MALRKSIYPAIIFIVFSSFLCKAQDKDEALNRWSGFQPTLRLGIGMQTSFFGEAGIGIQSFHYQEQGLASKSLYAGFEWVPTIGHFDDRDVYGWKLGYEMTYRLFAGGIEAKYQTRHGVNDFVITPKIGASLFGVVNLFYGYNISLNGRPFEEIEQHYISLIFSLNRAMVTAAKPSK